jgi:dTDP-4-amino-4,6-dideoxygalactose transaminase
MTTAEGGMITTDDERIYQVAVTLRDHGKPDPEINAHTEIGYNWRFSELHAVLGLQQMMKITSILTERRKIARQYDEKLAGIKGISKLHIPPRVVSSYYKYIVFLEEGFDRGEVKRELKDKHGVSLTGEVYAHPCHSQPVFARYPQVVANNPSDTFPNTEYVTQRHICLPLYPGLTEEDIGYVVESLKRVLS